MIKRIKSKIFPSEVRELVLKATSNARPDPCHVTMAKIGDFASQSSAMQEEVFDILWKRLIDYRHPKHVRKGLQLLDYLARLGNPELTKECRKTQFLVNDLTMYYTVKKRNAEACLHTAKNLMAFFEKKDEETEDETRRLVCKPAAGDCQMVDKAIPIQQGSFYEKYPVDRQKKRKKRVKAKSVGATPKVAEKASFCGERYVDQPENLSPGMPAAFDEMWGELSTNNGNAYERCNDSVSP